LAAAPSVIHPPHEKPITIAATAPPTAPQIAGFVDFGTFIDYHLLRYVLALTSPPTTLKIPKIEIACPDG
jgi:hypothetical protein